MIVKPEFAKKSLDAAGWKFETGKPPLKKYVVLSWPHSSNWDGFLIVMLARSIGLELHWMVKNSWVKGPLERPMKSIGAVPIDRSKKGNVVEQMVEQFRVRDELVLAIPPEGTRSKVDYWKSGFYYIALGAKVPVVCGYLDFARKRAGLGDAITLTGDVRADMDKIRAFYTRQNPIARFPETVGPMRLREEG